MMPNLLVGDFILVKKFSYSVENPITRRFLFKVFPPKRGDIVVFKYPLNPKLFYVKRVVGLPGDKIRYDFYNKRLVIQPFCIFHKKICSKKLEYVKYNNGFSSDFVKVFYESGKDDILKISDNINDKFIKVIRLMQFKECIDDISYNILVTPGYQDFCHMYYHQQGSLFSEWIVPSGKYFMMGDNRDNSVDSRYFGFIPEESLVGKVVFICMSLDKQKKNWPISIRVHRIGTVY
ncbi:MAG: signal peptidase I [Candidatus Westeberhardia cardiocondylae]|nr:signal peptidase I [Candidatus Westeberhardia cardiocondylae]